jgi:hypothetical protein
MAGGAAMFRRVGFRLSRREQPVLEIGIAVEPARHAPVETTIGAPNPTGAAMIQHPYQAPHWARRVKTAKAVNS